jgi:hypothetical protein
MRARKVVVSGLAIAMALGTASCSRGPTAEERAAALATDIAPDTKWYACKADPAPDDCAGYRSEWSSARFNLLNANIRAEFPGRFAAFKPGAPDPLDPKSDPPFILYLKEPTPEDVVHAKAFGGQDRIVIVPASASSDEKLAAVRAVEEARGHEDWARPILGAGSSVDDDTVWVSMVRATEAQVAEVRRRLLPVQVHIANLDEVPPPPRLLGF